MSRKAFEMIAEGLREAISIARGESKAAKFFVPSQIDVRRIRTRLHLSQQDFAHAFGFSVHQIRQWEQGRSHPLGAVRAYLTIIDRDPKHVMDVLQRRSKKPRAKAA
jgi:putative transcriptional regulator